MDDSSSNESESNEKQLRPDFAAPRDEGSQRERDDRPAEKTTKTAARDEKEKINVELELCKAIACDQEPTSHDGVTEEELPHVRSTIPSTLSKASSEAGDSENETTYIEEEDESEITQPGAVAVPGAPPFSSFDASNPGRNAKDVDSPMDEISAYLVEEGVTLEQRENIRRESIAQLLAEAVEAEDVKPERGRRDWRRWALLVALAIAIVASAIVAGITTSLRRSPEASSQQKSSGIDENVLAFVERRSTEKGFLGYTSAELRLTEFANISSGYAGVVACQTIPCVQNPGACTVGPRIYEPGCCLGFDCEEETKCGEKCPPAPESCYLIDSNDSECHSKDCYTCNKVDGQDIWMLTELVFEIDCLRVGTAIREENGEEYKWAIICGPVIDGGNEEANYGLGEYACNAYRTGAGFTHQDGGMISHWMPCQFISLGECGCAPADVYTFGLPEPTGPCLPGGNCTFLCSDAGKEHAMNLCHAFPGDIKWWEGKNFMSSDRFAQLQSTEVFGSVEIYIKGEN